jgi:hypothetical protein
LVCVSAGLVAQETGAFKTSNALPHCSEAVTNRDLTRMLEKICRMSRELKGSVWS